MNEYVKEFKSSSNLIFKKIIFKFDLKKKFACKGQFCVNKILTIFWDNKLVSSSCRGNFTILAPVPFFRALIWPQFKMGIIPLKWLLEARWIGWTESKVPSVYFCMMDENLQNDCWILAQLVSRNEFRPSIFLFRQKEIKRDRYH